MADHRKTFRPRHLLLGASLLLVGSVLPALAEDAGLKNGAAALSAGKYDNAVRMLSSTINSDNASPSDAARALYLRGIAYRKLGQPARALSDLGAAIFLGLPDEDRVKALVNRGLAYQAAGLSSQGDAEIAQARRVGGSGAVDQLIAEGGGTPASAASVAAFSTSVTPDAQGSAAPETPTRTAGSSGQWTTTADAETGGASASSGNRVSRWFGSLTGSSSSPSAPPPVSAPAENSAAATPVPAKPPAAPSTGWSAQTQASQTAVASGPRPAPPSTGWGAQTQGGDTVVASDATPSQSRWSRWFSKTAEADQPPPPPAPATGGRGGFQLQLATSRSEGDAQALWKQVSSANTGLSGKSPDIEKVDIGNFGTFYSLKVGPFPDKAESLKVCNALKRNGVDCSVVSPEAQ